MGITAKGMALYAKAQTGIELHFTRIAMGDGDLGSLQPINLTALISQKVTLPVTKLKVLAGGKAVIGAVLQPEDVTVGFYWKELGLFATDPDEGEILYYYGNAGALSEWIPPYGSGTLVEKQIDITPVVGNAANITATIDESLVYASQQELTSHMIDYSKHIPYAGTTGGTASTYTISTPAITTLTEGMAVSIKIHADSTGAATLNWNGKGAKGIKKTNGNNATLKANGIYTLRYDGTNFTLQGEGGEYGTATAPQVLEGYTFGTENGVISGEMPNRAGDTAALSSSVSGTTLKLVASNGYRDGVDDAVTITDANFTDSNIKAGTNVLGKTGTFTATATATASGILADQTAGINGSMVTGTAAPQVPNLLNNGSFEKSGNCWGTTGIIAFSTAKAKYGTKSAYFNNTAGNTNNYLTQNVYNVPSGNKVYMSAWFNLSAYTSGESPKIAMSSFGTVDGAYGQAWSNQTLLNQWQFVSLMSTTTNVGVSAGCFILSDAGTACYVDGVIFIDLTATFGAGKEPTKAQMDAIVQAAGGWWDSDLSTLTAAATATASQIDAGYSAYVNGQKIEGTSANKKWASGSVTSSNSTLSFTNASGGNTSQYYATASGLTFTPSKITLVDNTTGDVTTCNTTDYLYYYTASAYGNIVHTAVLSNYLTSYRLDGTNAYVSSSGFRLPCGGVGRNYTWDAYE